MRTGEEGRESGEQDKKGHRRKSTVTLERESKKYKDNYKYK